MLGGQLCYRRGPPFVGMLGLEAACQPALPGGEQAGQQRNASPDAAVWPLGNGLHRTCSPPNAGKLALNARYLANNIMLGGLSEFSGAAWQTSWCAQQSCCLLDAQAARIVRRCLALQDSMALQHALCWCCCRTSGSHSAGVLCRRCRGKGVRCMWRLAAPSASA